MFKQLQEQHKEWAFKNFGEQSIEDYSLGMIEEVGELAHAVLKRKQNIRNNEDHNENIKDAIGDITIYLIGYCNCLDIDLFIPKLGKHHNPNKQCDFASVSLIFRDIHNIIASNFIKNDYNKIVFLIIDLILICELENIDFKQTVLDTWHKVVSKRDWIKNPDCITSEDAQKEIESSGFNIVTSQGEMILVNLCDICLHSYPSCEATNISFGNGKGNDNIIKCNFFVEDARR